MVLQYNDDGTKEGKCRCGNTILFDRPGADVCCPHCGQWYNSSGQELRDPEFWGEETGEQFDSGGRYVGGGEDY